MRAVLIALVLIFVSAPAARADMFTGNELWASCSKAGETNEAVCFGYISGVLDTRLVIEVAAKNDDYCVPEAATYEQVRDVVVDWLRFRPGRRHEVAVLLVLEAIRDGFGCNTDAFGDRQLYNGPPIIVPGPPR